MYVLIYIIYYIYYIYIYINFPIFSPIIFQENTHNFFDKSIYLRLAFESHCFHGNAYSGVKLILDAHYSVFDKMQNS